MRRLLNAPHDPATSYPVIAYDLKFADHLIARALKEGSWFRNKAWAQRFSEYVKTACPGLIQSDGLLPAVKSNCIPLAFLARTAREKPSATTRVDAARRAINFLRALVRAEPLNDDPNVRLLARSVRNAVARTVRQSPAFPTVFAAAISNKWGLGRTWWKRMIALMAILALCTMARGAEVVSCLREGIV